jgi:hypothetical protein
MLFFRQIQILPLNYIQNLYLSVQKLLCKKTHMKIISYIMLVLIAGLCSCTKEAIAPIESFSADQKMQITLTASRTNTLDPWMVEIELTYDGNKNKVFQEFYADEVSKNNVSFQWTSNRTCLIQLTQRDGVIINVPIEVNE